ncbi:MAG: alpha/beta hydrolase [Gemmatimonadaceae bacterium]|nr:alpha/beta hydrolase [Gemmatimonadaceae bacterium]
MSVPTDPDIFRVPVGPGAMHVERFGYGGAPVVLLHGFGTTAFLWRHVGPMLAVRQMTAYAVDLFGYGESDRPFDADFGVLAQADYVDRALTALQIPRAALVGLDIGAIVAMALASDRRDRVSRLVMVGPPPLDDIPGPAVRDLQRDTARHALRLTRGLFGASALLTPFLEESVSSSDHMPAVLVGRYLAPYLGREGTNHLLALAGALEEEELEELAPASIRQEVLVVRGTRDRWCTKAIAEEYAASFPSGRYENVDEVGHLVPEESPETLAELIGDFASRR